MAVKCAATLARLLGASLVLVHVVVPRQAVSPCLTRGYLQSYRDEFIKAESVLRAARRLARDAVLQTELHVGNPAEAICERARDLGAELVIIGAEQPGKADDFVAGSVRRALMERSPCSVVVATAAPGRAG